MARSYEDFGTICCPEGAIGLSPGFQPWEALSKRICPEGARDHGATDGWHYACDLGSGAPSGLFAAEIRFPGLKPWAESSCPFGTKNHPNCPYLRAIQPKAKSYSPFGFGAINRPKYFLS